MHSDGFLSVRRKWMASRWLTRTQINQDNLIRVETRERHILTQSWDAVHKKTRQVCHILWHHVDSMLERRLTSSGFVRYESKVKTNISNTFSHQPQHIFPFFFFFTFLQQCSCTLSSPSCKQCIAHCLKHSQFLASALAKNLPGADVV